MKWVKIFLTSFVVSLFFVFVVVCLGAWATRNIGPTLDQLYGCTIKQQAPNGDCP